MVPVLRLLFLGAFLIASAHADLQLSPRACEIWADGAMIKFLAFTDKGGKDVTYDPPTGWEYSGSSTRFTLRPPNTSLAEGTIVKINLSQPAVFDDQTTGKLAAEVLASVPGGSYEGDPCVAGEKSGLDRAERNTPHYCFLYVVCGENYQRSMMFLNRGNEQLRFQFVSRASDFKDLQAAFQRSHFTWHNL